MTTNYFENYDNIDEAFVYAATYLAEVGITISKDEGGTYKAAESEVGEWVGGLTTEQVIKVAKLAKDGRPARFRDGFVSIYDIGNRCFTSVDLAQF